VPSGLNQPSSTSLAIARIAARHSDQYEPGTQRERGYMRGLSTVYRDDHIEDAATITEQIQGQVIDGIEVFTQDAEFEIDS